MLIKSSNTDHSKICNFVRNFCILKMLIKTKIMKYITYKIIYIRDVFFNMDLFSLEKIFTYILFSYCGSCPNIVLLKLYSQ